MSGYAVGPALVPDQPPWDIQWESDPRVDDGHLHEWESVLLQGDGRQRRSTEEVILCAVCHAPRCGDTRDDDPCMNRRHHRVNHCTLGGLSWRIGGTR